MYIVTTAQMQAAEKAADSAGVTYAQLMENAGQAVAQAIENNFDIVNAQVLVLVGPGNNGGDGLVVARHLREAGATVAVYIWQRDLTNDPNWELLAETGVTKILSEGENSRTRLTAYLHGAVIIVDALLGTGISRPIGGTLADLLSLTRQVTQSRRLQREEKLIDPTRPNFNRTEDGPYVVAIDLPSGLHSDTGQADPFTLTADITVTLAAVKQGHIMADGPNVCGHLLIGDIGINTSHYPSNVSLEIATSAKIASMLPARPANAHKGTFGRALLLAGSIQYTGAAMLATQSALRSGVGWAVVACPRPIYPILAGRIPEATYLPLPEDDEARSYRLIMENLERVTAMLIGPGLGQAPSVMNLLRNFLLAQQTTNNAIPLVIDADGLNILAKQKSWWRQLPNKSILTPHPGEMARLTGLSLDEIQTQRLSLTPQKAATWKQIILLKGAYTIIAAPDGRTMVLPFANPSLAKAGSGDVLAGIIVALRAQGVSAFESAVAGAYLHGLAGTLAGEGLGMMAVTAGDLVGHIPMALRELTGTI